MPIAEKYTKGLRDLLLSQDNTPVLIQLAKSVTKNVCSIEEPEEALGYLKLHMEDIHKLLFKRHITRELLFKYLHSRVPATNTDFTKTDLVMRVVQYWEQEQETHIQHHSKHPPEQHSTDLSLKEQDFPLHLIAREFSGWFFERFNGNFLNLSDLWNDAALLLTIMASDGHNELQCTSAPEVLPALLNAKQQFNFHFNPNLTHAGVQGRMDAYGQVLVLCCGTLHCTDRCVGVFECIFGLVRDPSADNNWKPKKIKLLLKSELQPPTLYSLKESGTLQEALALPAPSAELEQS